MAKKVRITVMRMACYNDLIAEYENPISHACDMKLGQTFIANGWQKPENFCGSAWDSISPFVMTLANGGEDVTVQRVAEAPDYSVRHDCNRGRK